MRAALAAGCIAIASLAAAFAAAEPASGPLRFFITGGGTLVLRNSHDGQHAAIRYRRDDGSYDPAALATVRRLFRSRSDKSEHEIPLRLIEILSTLQTRAGASELVLNSGYRTPALNEELRKKGMRAAGGSLHTEGLAADVAIPGADLRALWNEMRALECCGVGLYEHDGFLHLDVGAPRFWEPQTSRVEENLSAENARVFARTEFDRYGGGEPIDLGIHGITLPPIMIARVARLIPAQGDAVTVQVAAVSEAAPAAPARESSDCIPVTRGQRLRITGAKTCARAHVELRACPPRPGRTPEVIASNAIEVR